MGIRNRPTYCSDENRVKVVAGPAKEPYFPMKDSLIFNQGAGGMGDGIQGLIVVAGHRAQGYNGHITYRCAAQAIPFVEMFDGYDLLAEHDLDYEGSKTPRESGIQINRGYVGELMSRFAVPRWERYMENSGTTSFALPKLKYPNRIRKAGSYYSGRVALCPITRSGDRDYAIPGWLEVERLLNLAGYEVVVVHNKVEPIKGFKGDQLIGARPEEMAGCLLNCACVIGSDSGPSHLSAVMGVPTVVLCGQTKGEQIFGCYPKTVSLYGPLPCNGCGWNEPRETHCSPRCPSLQMILPSAIATAADDMVLKEATSGLSLVSSDRLRVIRDSVLRTNALVGRLAEVGVYKGGTAKLIEQYSKAGYGLRLFDTFSGQPEDDTNGLHKKGDFSDTSFEAVVLRLPKAEYFVGEFPATAPDDGEKYRFVHMDADTYQATAAGLAYFAPRMVRGGEMVFDDYGWKRCPGVAKALHEVFDSERIEVRACHQAIVRF